MSCYIVYAESGLIKSVVSHEDQLLENSKHIFSEESVDPSFWYVNEQKKLMPRVDYTIDNIPAPSIVYIEGVRYEVTETPQIKFDYPGEYKIEVIPEDPKYMQKEFTHVVDA